MTDLSLLHRAVLLNPEEDLARLAYADALEEAGETPEWREWLRQQLARPGEIIVLQPGRVLSVGYAGRWPMTAMAVAPQWGGEDARFTFRRGFLSAVRCDLASWLEHGRQLVASQPVERVELSDKRPLGYEGRLAHFWGWPWIADEAYRAAVSRTYRVPELGYAIPEILWRLLPDHGRRAGWGTEAEALSALSTACLNLFRPECGLPLLAMAPQPALAAS